MKSLILSAALAAMTLAGPAMAQDNTSGGTNSAPSPNVNVQVDAPAAPAAAPVESHTTNTVEKSTVVDHQTSPGGLDNTTLGILVGAGVLGVALVVGLAASNRG